jgi:hypothetical protein
MAADVAVAQDPAGYLKPSKDKSTERIDGIVASSWPSAVPLSLRRSYRPSTPCSGSEGHRSPSPVDVPLCDNVGVAPFALDELDPGPGLGYL